MKSHLLIAIAAAALSAAADPAMETSAHRADAPRPNRRALTGGTVLRPLPEGARALVFLDARAGATNHDAVAQCARRVEAMTRLYVKDAAGPLPATGGTRDIVVALVDKGDLAIFPDAGRAVVPARESDVESSKALWQAAIALFSLSGRTVNDLHGSGIVMSAAEPMGIPQVSRVFYVKALEEGWAPPPADEYQRALWEAHQAKTNAPAAK